jgi:hypothetical protein
LGRRRLVERPFHHKGTKDTKDAKDIGRIEDIKGALRAPPITSSAGRLSARRRRAFVSFVALW